MAGQQTMDRTINIQEDQVCQQTQEKSKEIAYIEIQESNWPNQEETNPQGDSVVRLEEGEVVEDQKGEQRREEAIVIVQSQFAEPVESNVQKEGTESGSELTNELLEGWSRLPEKELRQAMYKAMPEIVDKSGDLSFSDLHEVLKHLYQELNPNNNPASLNFYAELPITQEILTVQEHTQEVIEEQPQPATIELPVIEIPFTLTQNEPQVPVMLADDEIKEREKMTKQILQFLPEFQRDLNNMNFQQVRQLYKEVQAEVQKSLENKEMAMMNSGLKDEAVDAPVEVNQEEQVAPIVEKVSEQEVVAVESMVQEAPVEAIMVEEVSAPIQLNKTPSVCQSEEISKSKASERDHSIQQQFESSEPSILPSQSQQIDIPKQQESIPEKKPQPTPSVDSSKTTKKGGIAQLREELIKKSPEIAETILCLNDRELEEMYYQCKKVNPKKSKKPQPKKKAEETRESKNKTEIFEIPATKSGKRRSQTIVLMHTEFDDEPVYETRQKFKRTEDGVVKKTTTNQKEVSDVLKRILKVLAEE